MSAASRDAEGRQSWPVRVHRLDAEPGDDLAATTTAEARLDMMWPLTLEAWPLCGRAVPIYARPETPISTRPLVAEAAERRA